MVVVFAPVAAATSVAALSLSSRPGRAIYRWLLSWHRLEVETGRYQRTQRQERYCKKCHLKCGLKVVGDELHSLSSCFRAQGCRENARRQLLEIFDQSRVAVSSEANLVEMAAHVAKLSPKYQRRYWHLLGDVMATLDEEIQKESDEQHTVPNKWAEIARGRLIQNLQEAATSYFRKALRRQMRQQQSNHNSEARSAAAANTALAAQTSAPNEATIATATTRTAATTAAATSAESIEISSDSDECRQVDQVEICPQT